MSTSFTIHEIAGGVWAAIAPGTSGPAVSNAAIVDLGDKTIVVDTFMTGVAAEELAGEVRRLTGRAPFLVVNSHWHSDHVRGNRVFNTVPVVGTAVMRDLILEDAPRTPDEFVTRAAAVGDLARDLAGSAVTPEQKTRAAGMAALCEALAAEATTYRLVLPNVLIEDRLDIVGERRLSILGFGRGHTASDLVVHLPDDDVAIAGDLVWTGIHPKTTDGFPDDWAQALDRLAALRPTYVIPGHGQPGTNADVEAMAGYIRQLAALVGEVRDGSVDPEAAHPPSGSGEWQDVTRFRHGLRALAANANDGS